MSGFFDIVFMCNSQESCAECKYKSSECHVFCACFDGAIPCELWRRFTSFDDIIICIEKWWGVYNEQTTK